MANAPQDGDLTTIGHINLDSGQRYGNAAAQSYNDWGRAESATTLSWFVPVRASSHELELGLRYGKLGFSQNQCRNGSGRVCSEGDEGFTFFDGVDPVSGSNIPLFMDAVHAVGPLRTEGSQRSVYVDDTWRVRPDLTLRLGLRWDQAEQEHEFGTQRVDFRQLQPRLGAAWDVGGAGRNVLRVSWGRYMHPSTLALSDLWLGERSALTEFWLSCSSVLGMPDPEGCAALTGDPALHRSDPELWDPGGWVLASQGGSDGSARLDVGLDPMHVDQLVLGFERELLPRTSLELSYVRKEWRDLMEDTCIGNVPTPSPEADCRRFLLTNLPQATRDYEAWVLRFESRALERFHTIASWVYSESRGSHDGFISDFDFDVFPYHRQNRYGYLADHSRNRVKINGFVELAWDLLFAFEGRWRSEQRWTPIEPGVFYGVGGRIFVEPRGSRRENGLHGLDLQLSKGFGFGVTRLQLIGTVYNALDSERATDFCRNVRGCGAFDLAAPIDWQRPRSYEVGLRVELR